MAQGKTKSTSDRWGEIPDRERDEALQFLRERFPTRYKLLIERYYRALAEEDQR